MSFSLFKKYRFLITGMVPIAALSTTKIILNLNENRASNDHAIPPELLSLSEDKTILYGFKEDVTNDQILRNHYDTLVIPEGVTTIFDYAFAYAFDGLSCSVSKIVLNDEIEYIGSHAFSDCYGIKSVNFSDLNNNPDLKLTKIGSAAFYRNDIQGRLVIPHSVTSIGANCFNFCESISEVIFPVSLETVGKKAFAYCTHLCKMDFTQYLAIPNWLYAVNALFQDDGIADQNTKQITLSTAVDKMETWMESSLLLVVKYLLQSRHKNC